MPNTLRVRAREGIVTRSDLLDHGIKRMVGRRLTPHPGAANGYAWVDTQETEEIPNLDHYRQAIKDGSLWAADEETARTVFGATWVEHYDPSFGTAKAPAPTPPAPVTPEPAPEPHETDDDAAINAVKETV